MEKATKFFKSIVFLFGEPTKENYQKDLQSHSCQLPLGTMSSSSCAATSTAMPIISAGDQFTHFGFCFPRTCLVKSIYNNIVKWKTNDNPSSDISGSSPIEAFELREMRPFMGKEWILP